ncbi:MAG: hypothetical protein ACK5VI_10725 [Opitutia bacterium]
MPKPNLNWPTPVPPSLADLPAPVVKGAWKDETILNEFKSDPLAMARMIGSLRRYAKEQETEVSKLRLLNQRLLDDSGNKATAGDLPQRLQSALHEAYAMVADDIVVEPRVLVSMLERIASGDDDSLP